MTLRQAIGGDAGRLHEFLEELLDQEDAVVLLFDGHCAVNHVNGFGLSPCHLELLALEIERAVRTVGVKETSHRGRRDWPDPRQTPTVRLPGRTRRSLTHTTFKTDGS